MHMFKLSVSLGIAFSYAVLCAQPTPPIPGTIRGVVKASDGAAAAVQVRAIRRSPLPAMVLTANADPKGAFQITGLHPGDYELCFTATSGAYIDPCLWDVSGPIM